LAKPQALGHSPEGTESIPPSPPFFSSEEHKSPSRLPVDGFAGGTITLEALIWAKTIKLVISTVFLVAVKRSLQGLI
jgi:hypothetical protein